MLVALWIGILTVFFILGQPFLGSVIVLFGCIALLLGALFS